MKNNNKLPMIRKELFDVIWASLLHLILNESYTDPYSGLRIARLDFNIPYIKFIEYDKIVFAIMRLLIKYVYTTKSDYGKLTISYVMSTSYCVVPFTLDKAITFREDGKDLPVYALIDQMVRKKAEDYGDNEISSIFIRVYLSNRVDRQ